MFHIWSHAPGVWNLVGARRRMHAKIVKTLESGWVLRTCCCPRILTERSKAPLRTGFVPEEAGFRFGFERKLVYFEVSFRQ